MTFIPNNQQRCCLSACEQDKIDAGLCVCYNNVKSFEYSKDTQSEIEELKEIVDSCLKCEWCEKVATNIKDGHVSCDEHYKYL